MTRTQLFSGLLALVVAACAPATAPATPAPTQPPAVVRTVTPAPTTAPASVTPPPPTAAPATGMPPTAVPATSAPLVAPLTGAFAPQEVTGTGAYTLDPATGVLRLSDDFTVPRGPDLYVVLTSVADVSLNFRAFSREALQGPRLEVGKLKAFTGGQAYQLPAGVDLSPYRSVVIWCQAFSVSFLAAPLTP